MVPAHGSIDSQHHPQGGGPCRGAAHNTTAGHTEAARGRRERRSCTSPLRIIVSPRKPGKMSPYHPIVRGLFAMIPHQFYYQLVVLGLLWLCVMLHLAWPSAGVTAQTKPVKPLTPRRQRST